jgi:hypothetical protein
MIVDTPCYVPITVIRSNLHTPRVKEEIRPYSSQYNARFRAHPNNIMEIRLNYMNEFYIKRTWQSLQFKRFSEVKGMSGFLTNNAVSLLHKWDFPRKIAVAFTRRFQ